MAISRNIPIGEVLKEYGYVSEEQIQAALAYQKKNTGKRLGAILMELGYVTEKQMLMALGERLSLPIIDVSEYVVKIEAVEKIPRQLAEKYNVLAIDLYENSLVIATNDPLNFYGMEDIRQITGMNLEIRLSELTPLKKAIDYYYSEVSMRVAAKNANQDAQDAEPLEVEEGDGDAPVINLLNNLVVRAYNINASDIHIEPFEKETTVRLRVDGSLVDYVTLQRTLQPPLIARIKILSNLDIAEKRVPQDGHFRMKINGQNVNIRVSVLPTVYGEKAVMRILNSNTKIDGARNYGMSEDNYKKFAKMMNSPNGIIYITGPTGSGKTTTLYMALEDMAQRQVNISTIEDPVERNILRINQTQVNNMAGLTFEAGLRSLLRQDPDIIMVGETRDAETAQISVRAAITGHLVFSTLHTNDAASSIVRLQDMGVEKYLVANSLVGIVAQRLMRKVCPYCAVEAEATEEERELLFGEAGAKTAGPVKIKKPRGCHMCNNTGYKGRIAIHEMLYIDKTVRSKIAEGEAIDSIVDYARKGQGMRTLKDESTRLVLEGVTSMEEMLKVAYYFI